MANPAPQDNEELDTGLSFDNEPSDLEKRATELQRQRSLSRKTQNDYLQKQDEGPKTEFAGMEHPEIGELSEKPAEGESEEEEEDSEGYEEGESGEEEQEMPDEEQAEGPANANQPKINQLRTANLKITRQIQDIQKGIEKGLTPIKRQLSASKIADRSKNAMRAIRYCGAGFALWYTIILPLLALFGILAIALLWLAGFNLGPPSPKTRTLEQQLKNTRKMLKKQMDQRIRPLRQQLTQINRQLNSLQMRGAPSGGRSPAWGMSEMRRNYSPPKQKNI